MRARDGRPTWARAAGAAAAAGMLFAAGQQPAAGTHSVVTAVTASAYGYHADDMAFAGSPQPDSGPSPAVSLASDASNSPQSASDPTALVQVMGVATILTADEIDVSASASLGLTGSAVTTSALTNVNQATTQPATGSEVLTASAVESSCSASEGGVTRTTTLTGATLQTDSGHDINGDDDYTDPGEHPPVVITLPANPAPGLTISGHIHIGSAVDDFTVLFNEQVANPDGSSSVTAAHQVFGTSAPDILTGDLFLGRSVCGVTTAPAADLTVGIADSPDPVLINQDVTYTTTVSNLGPEGAGSVSVQSVLTGAKRVVSATGPAGACSVSGGNTKTIDCTLGTLAASTSAQVVIVAEAPNKAGTVNLTSTASSPADGTPGNNTDAEATTVVRP